MKTTLSSFFDPIMDLSKCDKISQDINAYLSTLQAVSKLIGLGFYVIDYHSRKFIYVSDDPLFLCGYTKEEVKEMGYSFYFKVVPKEDLRMLNEMNAAGFSFFYELNIEERNKVHISYDFNICHKNGSIILINHKLTPLALTEDGNIRLALCLFSLSSARKSGNVHITIDNDPTKYRYNFKRKQFEKIVYKGLTQQEKRVLALTAQGKKTKDIAELLFITDETVKFHKSNIIKKLKVKNSAEAVYFGILNKML
ncbi:LuxR family transcriptional regulator [Marinilabiliaceae bacterium JC017]|nr:LuxR family transcriptional regulator [Marinilabiliaceae bacterium JC017]